jgi:lipoprotein NlpD
VRVTRAIAAAYLGCLLASGCASSGPTHAGTYVVRPHDTLYSIAWRHDLDYRDVARWNHLGADYRVAIGQTLILHGPGGAAAAAAPMRPRAPRADPAPTPARPPTAAASRPAPAGAAKWVWPTERAAAPRPVPGGGVLLFGKLGQEVRAANAGRVVYTGNGIRGYGNLIIIKHDDNLLSSYAHNSDTLVKEGQEVGAGQTIAHMGTGPHQVSVLYFEIRADGRPVDPLPYLPPH